MTAPEIPKWRRKIFERYFPKATFQTIKTEVESIMDSCSDLMELYQKISNLYTDINYVGDSAIIIRPYELESVGSKGDILCHVIDFIIAWNLDENKGQFLDMEYLFVKTRDPDDIAEYICTFSPQTLEITSCSSIYAP